MRPSNFPGKVNSRRVGALARLEANPARSATYVDGEQNQEAHAKYLDKRNAEVKVLKARISNTANTVRTKKKRAAR